MPSDPTAQATLERPAGPPPLSADSAPARPARWLLRLVALGYLAMVLVLPVGAVIWRAFGDGIAPVWQAITTPDALHAFWLTVLIAGIAVPLNTLFGIACAVVLIRQRFPGRRLLDAVIDLPFAISPVVIGLALVLVYGQAGWLGSWLAERGIQVIFSLPGMVLAGLNLLQRRRTRHAE